MSDYYIGVMSGTSLDGIDISLCSIDDTECKELHFKEYPYDATIKEDILQSISNPLTLKELGTLDTKLGLIYLDALRSFLEEFSIDAQGLKAIGLHGQTLWHEPNARYPFSMQLGNASVVAKGLGVRVVSDFRSGDIANGGQGAPLTPAFHQFVFGERFENAAVLNLGGIANLTLLGERLIGFDLAPANILLDLWIQRHQGKKYDAQGSWAKSGKVDETLLKHFLQEKFFQLTPPKSTGRELFNGAWLDAKLQGFELRLEDVQATLLELSTKVISDAVKKQKVQTLLVCGGGAKNSFFLQSLAQKLPSVEIQVTDAFGVNSDSLEAMAFAWFARKCMCHEVVHLKSVTGAKKDSILGVICAAD